MQDTSMVGDVKRGDERKLSSWRVRRARPQRTLLCVYPEARTKEG